MTTILGYDRHLAIQAALLFAGRLASALDLELHVVHAFGMPNSPLVGASTHPNHTAQQYLRTAHEHVQAVPVQWTYDLTDGDPVDALLAAANAHAALMIVVGRPHGLEATPEHMLTNAVTRTLTHRSPRPVVVVPDVVDSLQ